MTGVILIGTGSWTEPTLIKSGRFYLPELRFNYLYSDEEFSGFVEPVRHLAEQSNHSFRSL